jgi:hypothetical protein
MGLLVTAVIATPVLQKEVDDRIVLRVVSVPAVPVFAQITALEDELVASGLVDIFAAITDREGVMVG